ncbi:MAG: Asp-tRNA(Asn)/Glu-tRNA(Gln) amidotransferase subunit GatC [Myxococcota bacterium]
MKLTVDQVRHVAKLARLALSPEEEARFGAQLSNILDAVDTLAQVDTTGVPATAYVLPMPPHAREDRVTGHLGAEAALANAPQTVGTSFAIPKVIE